MLDCLHPVPLKASYLIHFALTPDETVGQVHCICLHQKPYFGFLPLNWESMPHLHQKPLSHLRMLRVSGHAMNIRDGTENSTLWQLKQEYFGL